MILHEDSYNGGLSSTTVSMEYLFAFGGEEQKVSFLFLFLVLRKEMRMQSYSIPFPPLFSIFQQPSNITDVMVEIFEVNANRDSEDRSLCNFTRDTSLTPAPLKNQQLHLPY